MSQAKSVGGGGLAPPPRSMPRPVICPERRRVWDAMGLEERLAASDAIVGGGLAALPDPHCLLIPCPGCDVPALETCMDALQHAEDRILSGMGDAAEECRSRANRCGPEAVAERRYWTELAERWEQRASLMLSTWEAEDDPALALRGGDRLPSQEAGAVPERVAVPEWPHGDSPCGRFSMQSEALPRGEGGRVYTLWVRPPAVAEARAAALALGLPFDEPHARIPWLSGWGSIKARLLDNGCVEVSEPWASGSARKVRRAAARLGAQMDEARGTQSGDARETTPTQKIGKV